MCSSGRWILRQSFVKLPGRAGEHNSPHLEGRRASAHPREELVARKVVVKCSAAMRSRPARPARPPPTAANIGPTTSSTVRSMECRATASRRIALAPVLS